MLAEDDLMFAAKFLWIDPLVRLPVADQAVHMNAGFVRKCRLADDALAGGNRPPGGAGDES